MRKLFTLIAVIAAISMLGICASAFTVEQDGNTAKIIIDEDGDYSGVFILELDEGLSVSGRIRSEFALVEYNPANGKVVIAGIGGEAGDTLLTINFEGNGEWALVGEEDGNFDSIEFDGKVGTVAPPIITPVYCSACGELEAECTCNDVIVTPPSGGDGTQKIFDLDSITVEILEAMTTAELHALAEQLGLKSAGLSDAKLMDLIAEALNLDGYNPKAGVALAIVPAIVAAAAVVVARKRK